MSLPAILPTYILEIIGVMGFCLYVMNYALLTFHRINSASRIYFVVNLCAAICVLAGLAASFNLAAALIQVFWVVMSTVGLALRMRGPARRTA